jgi:hypothetical protein
MKISDARVVGGIPVNDIQKPMQYASCSKCGADAQNAEPATYLTIDKCLKLGSGVLVCCWLLFRPAGQALLPDRFYFSIQVPLAILRN